MRSCLCVTDVDTQTLAETAREACGCQGIHLHRRAGGEGARDGPRGHHREAHGGASGPLEDKVAAFPL